MKGHKTRVCRLTRFNRYNEAVLRELVVLLEFIISGHNIKTCIKESKKKGLSFVRRQSIWSLARRTVQDASYRMSKSSKCG